MYCLITTIAELKWNHKPLILTPRCNFTELWNISTLKRGNDSEKLYKRFSSFAKNIVRIMKGGGGYSSICNLFSEFWGHSLHDQIRKVVFDSFPTNCLAIFKPLDSLWYVLENPSASKNDIWDELSGNVGKKRGSPLKMDGQVLFVVKSEQNILRSLDVTWAW